MAAEKCNESLEKKHVELLSITKQTRKSVNKTVPTRYAEDLHKYIQQNIDASVSYATHLKTQADDLVKPFSPNLLRLMETVLKLHENMKIKAPPSFYRTRKTRNGEEIKDTASDIANHLSDTKISESSRDDEVIEESMAKSAADSEAAMEQLDIKLNAGSDYKAFVNLVELKREEMSRAVVIERVEALPKKALIDFVARMQQYRSRTDNAEAINDYITEGTRAVCSCYLKFRISHLVFDNYFQIESRI